MSKKLEIAKFEFYQIDSRVENNWRMDENENDRNCWRKLFWVLG